MLDVGPGRFRCPRAWRTSKVGRRRRSDDAAHQAQEPTTPELRCSSEAVRARPHDTTALRSGNCRHGCRDPCVLAIEYLVHLRSNLLLVTAVVALVALIVGATTESLRRERAQAIDRAMQLQKLNAEVAEQMEEVQTLSERLQESNDSLSDALDYAQDLATRGRRLQEVTAALAKAQTETEVADVVLGGGLAAAGATRGFLARVDGDRVEIFRASGYSTDVEARLLDGAIEIPALAEAVRTRQPVWVRSAEEHLTRYGHVYERAGITSVPHTSVSIPLLRGADVVGALCLLFVEPSTFDTATESLSLLLGQAAADALARARNFDAERAAREQAETIAQAVPTSSASSRTTSGTHSVSSHPAPACCSRSTTSLPRNGARSPKSPSAQCVR